MMATVVWSTIRHFTRADMACRCGCDRADMDDAFMKSLDQIRAVMKRPLVVTLGFRCPENHAALGGTPESAYTKGLAAELQVANGKLAAELVGRAWSWGMCGIGLDRRIGTSGFIHLDMMARPEGRPVMWSYTR